MNYTDSIAAETLVPEEVVLRDSSSGQHWIYRVVHSMEGCSPSRIDSVIQAHLPKKVLHLSNQPDTLEIPGLKTKSSLVSDLPCGYKLGYLNDNPLMHQELIITPNGVQGEPLAYKAWRDSWVTSFLILCYLIYIYIIRRSWKFLKHSTHDFFFPIRTTTENSVTTSKENTSVVFLTILISLMGGLVFFGYSQYQLDVFLGQLSPYTLLAIYCCCFLTYFIVKKILYGFINWVFFSKIKRQQWSEANSYLSSIEAILFFPIVIVCIYFDLPTQISLILLLIVLICVKILLLYKSMSIFLSKYYGFFHILLYLCALEIMPLVALWVLLAKITDSLIVKF